jgi:hypothetical protein
LGLLIAACLLGTTGAVLLIRRVKQLKALIIVCAWTKRVKFNGTWVSFEDYLHERFNLQFTHGICEEAAAKLQRESGLITKTCPASPHPDLHPPLGV